MTLEGTIEMLGAFKMDVSQSLLFAGTAKGLPYLAWTKFTAKANAPFTGTGTVTVPLLDVNNITKNMKYSVDTKLNAKTSLSAIGAGTTIPTLVSGVMSAGGDVGATVDYSVGKMLTHTLKLQQKMLMLK